MKRIIAFSLCIVLLFSACGNSDKEITFPAAFFGEDATYKSIDDINNGNYKSATLNEDGSVTFILSNTQHKELMTNVETTIEDSLDELLNDDTYSFVSITPKNNYQKFEIELSTEAIGLPEALSVLVFYTYGGLYNICSGIPFDNISVIFIDPNGDIIQTANSSESEFTPETQISNSTSSALQQEVEVSKKEITYKEATHNSFGWTDSLGNPHYTIICRIDNTCDTNIFLNPSTFDIVETSTDRLLGTGTASAYPTVIAPGKSSYYYTDITLNQTSKLETSVVSHLKIEDAKVEPINFPVTDVTFSTDMYGCTKIMGRVENTTSEEQNPVVISIMIYDRTGRPFHHESTYVSLAPNDKMGFEIITYALGTEYNVTYDAGAFVMQYNY